ncbi:uncharacterized protein LOC124449088 [Xenia sp. Carnegie-2017]|uniref:uncharacterized protein LOC124449088 n=1 Tax=Xenia sp. Carnegie-2017 TaxID=2897299 RepID=UPI001F04D3FE|nr:uncharacterized protein LOC124449088 [Xenia sp. Carnegie-2017]
MQIACILEVDHGHFADSVKKTKKVTKQVENIERRKKVAKRWKPGEREFNTAALSLELKRNESVIESAFSLAIERMFLVSLKNKYADGQAIAVKLSKQIKPAAHW